jgi:PAS domain S-box-containing protein
MTTIDWPLRFKPRRSPPFLWGLAVAATAMAMALGVRMAVLGLDNPLGLTSTYFPAFIVTTLVVGQRWGFAILAVGVALALRQGLPVNGAGWLTYGVYAVSSAATIWVSGALRETLLRLDEAHVEQEATRQALAESEARLLLAQEAGRVGLWDYDVVTDEGHWSAGLYRNLGLPVSDRSDVRDFMAVVHPDDREIVRQANLRAIREGVMTPTEYRIIRPDGQIRWCLSRGEVRWAADGAVERVLGVNIDVTDRMLADLQVRESEARFRALADSAPVLMWVTRSDGKRNFVNQAYVDYLGAGYEAALAFDWRERLHPDDLDRVLREQVAGEASRKLFILEARYRRFDGEHRWIRSYSQPRYAPEGGFEGFIGIGFDVTDAKRAEDDLKRINDLLAERVQAALTERDEAEAALMRAQKLEAVGQLTGGVAHDFNNLLMVVTGALELIRRHPDDAVRRERMLEAALGAARRGERLTHQLLAFSRRQPLKPELVRIDGLLGEAEPLLRRAVGEAVSFSVSLGAHGAVGLIDPAQFEAAILNLVVNARDATSSGGAIRIESAVVALAAGKIEETAPGDYVRVTVSDTGVGMDADTLGRVFEPFFTTKEVGKGTGLGLSQVYGFARQSGGAAVIESAPGQGCAVRIYLPLSAEAAPAAPESPAVAGPAGPSLTVLLVEDDADVADMVTDMLRELGHTVRRADAAEPALEMLRGTSGIDLVLTDLVMPGGFSGVDLARAAVEIRPGLPIILSSGYTGDALASADSAPWPLLRKPYATDALVRAIRTAREHAPETA